MQPVELLFLGTGTSAGVPMIGCDCEICRSADPHDKRTRPSVVISYPSTGLGAGGQTRVLVDTTPELRLQCVANGVNAIDAVVYTHAHADHIMGLDDVRRFNAIKQGPMDVWADGKTFKTLDQCFGYAFKEPTPEQKLFRPNLVKREITGPFEIGAVTWTPIPLIHADTSTLGFRIGNLAYCTDVSEIPEASFDLLRELDVLVLDALGWKRHPAHLSVEQAIEASKRIGAKLTRFTHIAHTLSHQETNQLLPDSMQLAFDGERLRFPLPPGEG